MPNTTLSQLSQDYYRIEKAIAYIKNNASQQPDLVDISASVHLSEYHFQRMFSRWAGISPKRFLQYITKEYAKKLLRSNRSVMDTAYDIGLSGGSRLHDLFVVCEAVTPGEYKRSGEGLQIFYGCHPTPFGYCLLGATERGVCYLEFQADGRKNPSIQCIQERWPRADIVLKPKKSHALVKEVFDFNPESGGAPLHLYVKGSNFQIKVWEALLKIPLGNVVTYEDVARQIKMPKAARAVGNAVGQNPIPFLIPCHRVIRKMGEFGNYGGGKERKKAMLGWEAARTKGFEGPRVKPGF
ncbi:bifunctional helix-turn-helix domain-containing protein/methylated-DNA--[protein]-cysteine S-methyltransferase [Thermodesulfobacteriota bacterium]